MAEANTSELTNAHLDQPHKHLDQFTNPEEFVSPEQFDALKEEYAKVNPELLANDRAQKNVQVLIQSIEEKDMVQAEIEQKNRDLTKKVEDLGKQLEHANERNEQTELKLEENKTKCAVSERKCDEFFKQVEELRRELRDKENRIQIMTDSVQEDRAIRERNEVVINLQLMMARRALEIGQPIVLRDEEMPDVL